MEGGALLSSPGTGAGAQARRGFDLRVCLALGLLGLLVYNANMRLVTSSDNYPARYLPFSILGYGTLCLDPLAGVVAQGRTQPYWVIRSASGRMVSQYPVVTPLLVTPLYLPAIAYLHLRGWTDHRVNRLARLMEKLSASVIASMSVALMYLLLRRRADARAALLLAIAYGFGTDTWMIGSQGLWQHGMGELLLVIALLLVTGPCTALRSLALGAVCALITFNRPPDAIMAAAVGLYGLRWAGRKVAWLLAGGVVPGALLLAYNIGVTGHVLGGYAVAQHSAFFRFSLPQGVAGLLFSLGRGLFVFSPFLLALPLGLGRALRDRGSRPLTVLACIAFVAQVALYAKTDWRGGVSYGPRYLTDVLPLLVWMLPPVVAGLGRIWRAAFVAAVCVSAAIQAVGAFWYTGRSDEAMNVTSADPVHLNAVWSLRSTPFIMELGHPRAARDLTLKVEGGIDNVKPAGNGIEVDGWTLVNDGTPLTVVVMVEPGPHMIAPPGIIHPVGRAKAFLPHPGATSSMRPNARPGWSIDVATGGLAPGDYMLEVIAQGGGNEGGEFQPVAQRPFQVPAPR